MIKNKIDLILRGSKYFFYLKENLNREQNRRYCKHDWQHMLDVARITYILALENKLGLSKDVIYAAGLLHDIGRWKEYDTGEDHALVSASLARELLLAADFGRGEIEIITTAIKEHRKMSKNSSQLGKLLCRADDLARPCLDCKARVDCYKITQMETANHCLIY